MSEIKPIPDGYTAITPYLIVEDAAGYLDFLAKAFGAVERLRIPMGEGLIGHAEVEIGGAAVMLSDAPRPTSPSPARRFISTWRTLTRCIHRRWAPARPP